MSDGRISWSAIFVRSESLDELRAAFDKLADGASEDRFQELHELPFGTYGQLVDRFGVHWIFVNPLGLESAPLEG